MNEGILLTLKRLCDQYGDDMIALPGLCSKIGKFLHEASQTVQESAIEVLAKLHPLFGDEMIVSFHCIPAQARLFAFTNKI